MDKDKRKPDAGQIIFLSRGEQPFFQWAELFPKTQPEEVAEEHIILQYLEFLVNNKNITQKAKTRIVLALSPLFQIKVSFDVVEDVRAEFNQNISVNQGKRFYNNVANEEASYWEDGHASINGFDFFAADRLFYRKGSEVNKVIPFNKNCQKPETVEWDIPTELLIPRRWFLICLRMFRHQYQNGIFCQEKTLEEMELEEILFGKKPNNS
ncbi:MAG: hypothetical protein WCT18_00800 [Patescibacteria group bacterium]